MRSRWPSSCGGALPEALCQLLEPVVGSLGFHGAVDGHHPGLVGHEADEGRLRDL
jgi:hypothetical protein